MTLFVSEEDGLEKELELTLLLKNMDISSERWKLHRVDHK
jgi:hypothetical protein